MHLEPYIIPHFATLHAAMVAIDDNAREFVIVVDDNGVACGTVTDGDTRRALLAGHGFDFPVSNFMMRSFVSVGADKGRGHVLDIMRARDIRQIPVLDALGRPIGIHFLRQLIGSEVKPNMAVIMAGGKGTRLLPITENCPKPLVTVAGRPILEHLILHLVGQGIRNITLAINHLGNMIEAYFQDGSALGCNIDYIREEKALGTAGALSLLSISSPHPFLVLNGDIMTNIDVLALLDYHEQHRALSTVCGQHFQYEVPFGVLEVDGAWLNGIVEKPSCHFLINAGIYAVEPKALSYIPYNKPFTMVELLDALQKDQKSVAVYPMHEQWIDIGRPAELAKARGAV